MSVLKTENKTGVGQGKKKLNLEGFQDKKGGKDYSGFNRTARTHESPTITCSPSPCIFSEDTIGCIRGIWNWKLEILNNNLWQTLIFSLKIKIHSVKVQEWQLGTMNLENEIIDDNKYRYYEWLVYKNLYLFYFCSDQFIYSEYLSSFFI